MNFVSSFLPWIVVTPALLLLLLIFGLTGKKKPDTAPQGTGSGISSAGSGGLFQGLWSKHSEKVLSITVITIALVLINLLCWSVQWQWWTINWENRPFFYLSMASIIIACRSLMADHVSGGGKLFAVLVLGFVVAGWTTVSLKAPGTKVSQKNYTFADTPSMDAPVICYAGKPTQPFYIADRDMDLPMDTDIIVWPLGGTKTVIRLTDENPHINMSDWRVIQIQLPIDYMFTPRLKKPKPI